VRWKEAGYLEPRRALTPPILYNPEKPQYESDGDWKEYQGITSVIPSATFRDYEFGRV